MFQEAEEDEFVQKKWQELGKRITVPTKTLDKDRLRFYAMGDWGADSPVARGTSQAMAAYGRKFGAPDFILALGDNFYPNGVFSVDSPNFTDLWLQLFLKDQPELHVPWHVVLGNHDYMGTPQAQVDYTFSDYNKASGELWQMPARNYNLTYELSDGSRVNLFALDTNGVQGHVRHQYPGIKTALHGYLKDLEDTMQKEEYNNNDHGHQWKVVFAHHPIYTKGRRHGRIADALRLGEVKADEFSHDPTNRYDMEAILRRAKCDVYYTGHDHVLQYHERYGIHHVVAGAASESGFFGGPNPATKMKWVDEKSNKGGFTVTDITKDTMEISFIQAGSECKLLKKVTVERN